MLFYHHHTLTFLTKPNLVHKSVFRFMETQIPSLKSPKIENKVFPDFQDVPLSTYSPAADSSPFSIFAFTDTSSDVGSSSRSAGSHDNPPAIVDDVPDNVVHEPRVHTTANNELPETLPPIIVQRHAGLEYPQPVVVPPDTIGPGNFTLDDCMQRPLDVVTFNLEHLPVTQRMFDNLSKAVAFLQVMVPQTEQNVDQAKAMSVRTQATLAHVQALEKSLSTSWFDRKYVWWIGAASTISLVVYMIMTKATPTLVAPTAIEIMKQGFYTTKESLSATSKKVTEQVTPESTLNLFLDNPLTCLAIVGITAISVIGIRGSFRIVSWSLSKLKK
jgi:hypothetical protein